MTRTIYLDHIAATPLLPLARAAMLPYLAERFFNPQSRYALGTEVRAAVASARKEVANLMGADPSEIIFTASGSEANNLAIRGVVAARSHLGRHLITSVIEHFSVAHPIKQLEQEGYAVTWIPVDHNGHVDPSRVARAIRPETLLISIMHANNEIGTLQPIEEIAAIAAQSQIPLHIDAVATVGRIPCDVSALGADLISLAAQTFYGPKGVGALYVRLGTRVLPLVAGGVQESGRRAGTENVAGIVGMGVAAAFAQSHLVEEGARLMALRDDLVENLLAKVDRIHLTGDRRHRLPHIASFAVEFVDGEALVRMLERHSILAASGSSCSSEALKISPVLTAIGLPANVAQGAVVFSLGRDTTQDDIEVVKSVFPSCVSTLRAVSPLYRQMTEKCP